MTGHAKRTPGVWLILLLLVGCGRDEPSTAQPAPGVETFTTTAVRTTDACAIALTPHTGEGRLDQEIVRLQQATRRATEPVAFLERLGWAFVAKARHSFDPGFYMLAESCALCLAAQRPQSAEALLLRGHVLHNLHRFREGEVLAYQLVAQRGLAYDYGLLGDVLLEQGKLAEAIEAYQGMMDQKPGPQAYSRTAYVRWLKGDLAGALEVMRMAVGVSGFHDTEAAAWAYARLALYELQAGLLPQASQHVAAALALQPQYPPALLTRGRMLLAEGKNAAAVAPLAHAVQLHPLPEYQWGFIEALQAANRAEEAGAIETQLMQRGATNDRRTFALYLATTRRDVTTALQLAEEEITVRADVFTLDTLAWALHAVGRYQEARAYSRRALAEGTQEARLFYHAGVIAAAVQEPEEAAHWLAKATAIRQMLLPSEREHLATVTVAVLPQPSTLAGRQTPEPEHDNSHPEGSKR
jgi:tetratricopeptide (TPR) repeat protein